jgi:hypothetical protein
MVENSISKEEQHKLLKRFALRKITTYSLKKKITSQLCKISELSSMIYAGRDSTINTTIYLDWEFNKS